MGLFDDNSDGKKAYLNPANLFDALSTLFGGTQPENANVRAQILWTGLTCWITAASLATAQTRKEYAPNAAKAATKPTRINLGPVYLF